MPTQLRDDSVPVLLQFFHKPAELKLLVSSLPTRDNSEEICARYCRFVLLRGPSSVIDNIDGHLHRLSRLYNNYPTIQEKNFELYQYSRGGFRDYRLDCYVRCSLYDLERWARTRTGHLLDQAPLQIDICALFIPYYICG